MNLPGDELLARARFTLVATLVEHCGLKWICRRITWGLARGESSGEQRKAVRNRTPAVRRYTAKFAGTSRSAPQQCIEGYENATFWCLGKT